MTTTDPDAQPVRPAHAAGVPDDALAEINRLWTIARVFSNTAHEVNNALQVIAGNAELLEARGLDPDVKRRIETVRAQAERAAREIERLLVYVRASPHAVEALDVWSIAETAVAMRAASAGRNRIRLTIDRQDNVPCTAMVDGARTLQVLLDLLLVAEAGVARRPNARIAVSVEFRADEIATVISAKGDARRDAEPEAVASPAADAFTSGAALWAASHVAAAQGGRVAVSASNDGSTLALIVPAATPRNHS